MFTDFNIANSYNNKFIPDIEIKFVIIFIFTILTPQLLL